MKIIRCLMLMAAIFGSASIFAMSVREFDLQEKVSKSRLVVIGTVEGMTVEDCIQGYACATIRVENYLKGHADKVIVLFGGPIAESAPYCCSMGERYLFFLSSYDDTYYQATNSPHGIYPVGSETRPW